MRRSYPNLKSTENFPSSTVNQRRLSTLRILRPRAAIKADKDDIIVR